MTLPASVHSVQLCCRQMRTDGCTTVPLSMSTSVPSRNPVHAHAYYCSVQSSVPLDCRRKLSVTAGPVLVHEGQERQRLPTTTIPVPRRRRVCEATLALLAATCLLVACGGAGAATSAPAPEVGTKLSTRVPSDILHLPLRDSTGKATSLAAFDGMVLVISDAMTLCQETCPLDTANIVETARAVQRAGLTHKVEFLSITVDPARDTTAQLAAYRHLFAPTPTNWKALTGSQADLARLWKYLGVYHEKVPSEKPFPTNWRTGEPLTYDIEHSDLVYFVDASSRERFLLDSPGHVPAHVHLPATMNSFLDAAGRRRLVHPDSSYWTVPQALHTLSWLTGHRIPYRPSAASERDHDQAIRQHVEAQTSRR